MKKTILTILALILLTQLPAQNLLLNPDAESLPKGTGWTIVSEGAITCVLVPTNNYLNWTMIPNGSANYPFDHTTGTSGGTVFFSGCDTYLSGPFELQQTIDVSADAVSIDAGNQSYVFSGYVQTPVSNQTDRGRFIVDFLNAANNILGTSYTSNWQSNLGGSGTSWNNYTNSRTAPSGTRKIKVRLQTQLINNQPAINVYFDDVSLTKPTIVPLGLVSFTGKETDGNIRLNWTNSGELSCKQFNLERSTDAAHFNSIVILQGGSKSYYFVDENIRPDATSYFYRLKMTGMDDKIIYSNIVWIKKVQHPYITLSPNPANNIIAVTGISQPGVVSIINYSGSTLLTAIANSASLRLDISRLPEGFYTVRFHYEKNSTNKKLVIHRK